MAKSNKGRRNSGNASKKEVQEKKEFQEGVSLRHPFLEGITLYLCVAGMCWFMLSLVIEHISREMTLLLTMSAMIIPTVLLTFYRFCNFPGVKEVAEAHRELGSLRGELALLKRRLESRENEPASSKDSSEIPASLDKGQSPETIIKTNIPTVVGQQTGKAKRTKEEFDAIRKAARASRRVLRRLERENAKSLETQRMLENENLALRGMFDVCTLEILFREQEGLNRMEEFLDVVGYYRAFESLPFVLVENAGLKITLEDSRQEVLRYEEAFSDAVSEIELLNELVLELRRAGSTKEVCLQTMREEVSQLKAALSSAVSAGFGFRKDLDSLRQELDDSYAEVSRIDEEIGRILETANTLLTNLIEQGNGWVSRKSLVSFWVALNQELNAETSPN